MKGKIAFEEHMGIESTIGAAKGFAGESGRWDDFQQELLDLDERRLANYRKLQREERRLTETLAERHQRSRDFAKNVRTRLKEQARQGNPVRGGSGRYSG